MAIVHARDIQSTPHLIENQTILDKHVNDDAAIQWRKINSRGQVRDEDIISISASKVVGLVSSSGDHGSLTGLTDDDHSQYILGDRADWTDLTDGGQTALHSHSGGSSYDATAPSGISEFVEGGQTSEPFEFVLPGTGISVTIEGEGHALRLATVDSEIDHSALANLTTGDPHTQYRLESENHTHQSTGAQGGQLDHGLALTGLTDDDHTQYLLASQATDRATFTTNWGDLTDGGETALHSHTGGSGYDASLTTGVSEFVEASVTPQAWEQVLPGPAMEVEVVGQGHAVRVAPLFHPFLLMGA